MDERSQPKETQSTAPSREIQLALITAAEALSAALSLLKPNSDPHPHGQNVISLEQGYQDRDYFSGKVSEISRQLGFAGIAIVWLFKMGEGAFQTVPPVLVPPALLLVLGLVCDLLHYLVSTALWHRLTKRAHTQGKKEFVAPKWINTPGWVLFFAKVGATGFAYVYLILFLMSRIILSAFR